MQEGTLPFRYLGVPLAARKLNYKECSSLLKHITARIHHWTSKWLSYVGRLTLKQLVLEGVKAYWAQIFLLPKAHQGG